VRCIPILFTEITFHDSVNSHVSPCEWSPVFSKSPFSMRFPLKCLDKKAAFIELHMVKSSWIIINSPRIHGSSWIHGV
jgi:hypothetical protein